MEDLNQVEKKAFKLNAQASQIFGMMIVACIRSQAIDKFQGFARRSRSGAHFTDLLIDLTLVNDLASDLK